MSLYDFFHTEHLDLLLHNKTMATNRSGRRTIPGYQSLDMEKDDKNAFNQDTTVDGLRNNNEYVEGVTLCWQNLQVRLFVFCVSNDWVLYLYR